MKQVKLNLNWLNWATLALTLPTLYFIFINVMKYNFGVSAPYDAASPLLENYGISESIGWNINLLILFGPVLALMISILQILKIKWDISAESIAVHFLIKRNTFSILVSLISSGALAILLLYLVGENFL